MSAYFESQLLGLFSWMLCILGIGYIGTSAYISQSIRDFLEKKSPLLGRLISCPTCFSFWVGSVLGYLHYSPTNNIILDGCMASGVMWWVTKRPPYDDDYCDCD